MADTPDDSQLRDLRKRLAAAQERAQAASRAVSGNSPDSWAAFEIAQDEMLSIERQIAAARGEEYADPLDFPVQWDTGAPLPHFLINDHRAFLTFYVRKIDPNWDGSYTTLVDPAAAKKESLAIVEFAHCMSGKFGSPNDEVLHGHPLYGKGLDSYTAQVVRNSHWLAELEAINSVHSYYQPQRWRSLHHFIFWFHDKTFECIAESFTVELRNCSMTKLLEEVSKRLLK